MHRVLVFDSQGTPPHFRPNSFVGMFRGRSVDVAALAAPAFSSPTRFIPEKASEIECAGGWGLCVVFVVFTLFVAAGGCVGEHIIMSSLTLPEELSGGGEGMSSSSISSREAAWPSVGLVWGAG